MFSLVSDPFFDHAFVRTLEYHIEKMNDPRGKKSRFI